jgi:hypothetical protein
MNKNGIYEYGIIHECGYFGDISILLNQPSEYAYYNNHDSDIAMLCLDAKSFLAICNQHPYSRDLLKERAKQRRKMFENYKTKVLLKMMKTVVKFPHIAIGKEGEESTNGEDGVDEHKHHHH